MQNVIAWCAAHEWLAWLVLAASLNLLLRWKSPEAWLAFAERRPYLAAGVRIFRALFPDPAKAAAAIQGALERRAVAKAPPAARAVVEVAHTEIVLEPAPPVPDAAPTSPEPVSAVLTESDPHPPASARVRAHPRAPDVHAMRYPEDVGEPATDAASPQGNASRQPKPGA